MLSRSSVLPACFQDSHELSVGFSFQSYSASLISLSEYLCAACMSDSKLIIFGSTRGLSSIIQIALVASMTTSVLIAI
jgi:hypothetical protein